MTGHQREGGTCAFCAIMDGTESADRVYETEEVLAFLPLAPATPGHTLIVPKAHVTDLWHANMATLAPVMEATLEVSAALRRAFDPDGLNLINSAGAAATQTVFHIHFHLVPRWDGDGIADFWPDREELPPGERAEIAEKIRRCVGAAGSR
ncbi:HIT family protein [Streptomyces cyaneofuscatus]|uniref:HIT family protein n=1 Tax=Streptomyces cyaneofuscatus TaxID=66883 RepID=UPI00386CE813|nr:HIT family protein [Streptomyces cyaneofuscatus]